ncbi:MAG: hypothetical protein AAF740_09155 [Bacteroidota bacterium]
MITSDLLRASDPVLAKIMDVIPVPSHKSTGNVFHDLMSCIIEQQIHYRSTKRTFEKMLAKAEISELTSDNFSNFEEIAFESVKISERKYETILRVVEFWQGNVPDWKMLTDEEVRKAFKQIKGVGVWTVDMILLFTIERPDIFPADDYHLKMLMTSLYGLDAKSKLKAQMKKVAEKWSPCQSLAVRYLLAWKEYQKQQKL